MLLRPLELPDVPTFVSWGRDRTFCEHAGWTLDRPAAVDANRASVRILTSLGMAEIGRGEDEEFLGTASYYRRFSLKRAEWGP